MRFIYLKNLLKSHPYREENQSSFLSKLVNFFSRNQKGLEEMNFERMLNLSVLRQEKNQLGHIFHLGLETIRNYQIKLLNLNYE